MRRAFLVLLGAVVLALGIAAGAVDRDALRERVKGLFTRPTPWEKLNGRERARRLVQTLYRRRSGKIGGIRTLTAREALSLMNLKPDARQRACEAYDRARYSPHDVDAAQMDALRKEIRP